MPENDAVAPVTKFVPFTVIRMLLTPRTDDDGLVEVTVGAGPAPSWRAPFHVFQPGEPLTAKAFVNQTLPWAPDVFAAGSGVAAE